MPAVIAILALAGLIHLALLAVTREDVAVVFFRALALSSLLSLLPLTLLWLLERRERRAPWLIVPREISALDSLLRQRDVRRAARGEQQLRSEQRDNSGTATSEQGDNRWIRSEFSGRQMIPGHPIPT